MYAVSPKTLSRFNGTTGEWHPYSNRYPNMYLSDGVSFLAHNGQDWLIDLICAHQKGKVLNFPTQIWHLRLNPHYHPVDPDTMKIRGLFREEKEPFELVGESEDGTELARVRLQLCEVPIEHFNHDFQIYLFWSTENCMLYLPNEVEA